MYVQKYHGISDEGFIQVAADQLLTIVYMKCRTIFLKLLLSQLLLKRYGDLTPFMPALVLNALVISSVHGKHFARGTWKQALGF